MVKGFLTQEPGLKHYKNLLREPGDKNHHLESSLPENPDFEKTHDISNSGPPHRLTQIPEDEPENILYQNPLYHIADAKGGPPTPEKGWRDGRKGHDVRTIGIWREPGEIPPVSETYHNDLNIAEALRDITFEEIERGYGLVGGSMSSFEDHLHFIASDLETELGAESDLPSLNNWFLYRVENGEAIELEDYQSREKIGKYLEELLL